MLPHVFIFIDSLSLCNTFRPNHRALTSLHQFLANVSLMTVVLAVVPILLRLNRDPWKNDFFWLVSDNGDLVHYFGATSNILRSSTYFGGSSNILRSSTYCY